MAKRRDKASGKKRGQGRRGSGPGKGKHTRAGPAQRAQRAQRARGSGGPVDVTAMTVWGLAELLGVPSATVRQHVKGGAPCAGERPRRLSLIEYAAWANRRLQRAQAR